MRRNWRPGIPIRTRSGNCPVRDPVPVQWLSPPCRKATFRQFAPYVWRTRLWLSKAHEAEDPFPRNTHPARSIKRGKQAPLHRFRPGVLVPAVVIRASTSTGHGTCCARKCFFVDCHIMYLPTYLEGEQRASERQAKRRLWIWWITRAHGLLEAR